MENINISIKDVNMEKVLLSKYVLIASPQINILLIDYGTTKGTYCKCFKGL